MDYEQIRRAENDAHAAYIHTQELVEHFSRITAGHRLAPIPAELEEYGRLTHERDSARVFWQQVQDRPPWAT
jgi:hypothetical protein